MKTAEKIATMRQPSAGPDNQPNVKPEIPPTIVRLSSPKIQPRHLEKLAVVYVRQSSPQQVLQHRESTDRQYAFGDRAVAFGWPRERVLIIDEDLGKTGRTTDGRAGFQRLVTEVTLNHVGIVMGLEMSRLARSSKDWHDLFETCGIFGTLLADEDGVYESNDPNDRLLLGLKGIMSEMELHIMRSRLERGRLNKARRGELFSHAPMGYVRSAESGLAFDPDEQVQHVMRLIFAKFEELGSAAALLHYLVREKIRLGIRPYHGPNAGQLEWRRPCTPTLLMILHNPTYAGAYTFGRYRIDPTRKIVGRPGSGVVKVPMDDWAVLRNDQLPAYITWEQYLANQKRLDQNQTRHAKMGAPRDGPALLAGLAICGKCGHRLMVSYGGKASNPAYLCVQERRQYGGKACQSIVARPLDELLSGQMLQVLEPAALELSVQASANLQQERNRLSRHWKQSLERTRYDSARAARQYQAVEPENRLVARELERQWEKALLSQRQVEEEFDRFQQKQPQQLTSEEEEMILSLSTDLPALWNAPTTSSADRQTIIRHLVERIVVTVQGVTENVDVTIHWAGGFTSQHEIRRPVLRYEQLHNYDQLMKRVAELRDAKQTGEQIAEQLNREGFYTTRLQSFKAHAVRQLWSRLKPRIPKGSPARRPPQSDEWWLADLSLKLSVPQPTLHCWRQWGWLHGRKLPGKIGRWIIWADDDELNRLIRLRDNSQRPEKRYPVELTTPNPRPTT